MDKQHTPEPWHTENDGNIYDENCNCVAACIREIEEKHDARRIVACVNACAGIKTSDLEAMRGTTILATANAKFAKFDEEMHHRIKVEGRQHLSELLAALERIANLPPERMDEAHAMALTAIADIKETAHE